MSMHQARRKSILISLALCPIVALLLACAGTGAVATRSPRWACPSPTPQPYGEAGPIKTYDQVALPTAAPSGPQEYDQKPMYYEEWEQEYGEGGSMLNGDPAAGGPPFPSPTPYSIIGTSYVFGQRIEVRPFHVMVSALGGDVVAYPGIAPNTQQIYKITITWINHAADALPFSYETGVHLRAVTDRAGRILTDSNWTLNPLALEVSRMRAPESLIPPGESTVTFPIIAPIGTPKTVDVAFQADPNAPIRYADATPGAGEPTPTAAGPASTPTPNISLQAAPHMSIVVSWTNAEITQTGAPPCGSPGAMTSWDTGSAWGDDVPIAGLAAPPGAERVVQLALNQVGKNYIWGAVGPESFDCSGLIVWSYAQIGIGITHSSSQQFAHLRPIALAEAQPGDLAFFNTNDPPGAAITHVGMLVGDVDGDGAWDMVHAASPNLGIRFESNVFGSAYYSTRLRGVRTVR